MANRREPSTLSQRAARDRSARVDRRLLMASAVLVLIVAAAAAGYFIGHHPLVPSSPSDGSGAAYAGALDQTIMRLNARRVRADSALRVASTSAAQAKAEDELAVAHAQAASAIAKLNAGPASDENAALESAMRRVSAAYRALAGAAERQDARAYQRARRSLAAAEKALSGALATVDGAGSRTG
jgi:hypothetical protein